MDNCERGLSRARLCNELGHYRVFVSTVEHILNEEIKTRSKSSMDLIGRSFPPSRGSFKRGK